MLEQILFVVALVVACLAAVRLTTGGTRKRECGSGGSCGCGERSTAPVRIARRPAARERVKEER